MTDRVADASPRFKARMAGLFYVLTAGTSVFGQMFVLGKLVVEGDAAATAAHIQAHQPFGWDSEYCSSRSCSRSL
jgi:hypothetical protein